MQLRRPTVAVGLVVGIALLWYAVAGDELPSRAPRTEKPRATALRLPAADVAKADDETTPVPLPQRPDRQALPTAYASSHRVAQPDAIARATESAPTPVRRMANGSYEVARQAVALEVAGQGGGLVRPVPQYRGGRCSGFQLVHIAPGSLLEQLGLRSGDVILAVNGVATNSPNQALLLVEALETKARVTVLVERSGEPLSLRYRIR